ncbi:MAG: hypothetical protein ACRDRJ_37315 [Streptosporangiaceae bacterium]
MTGHVKLSIPEYNALLDAARPAVPVPPSQHSEFGVAVALVTARVGGIPATAREIAPTADRDAVITSLVTVVTAMMRSATSDHGADLLQALGLIGADEADRR